MAATEVRLVRSLLLASALHIQLYKQCVRLNCLQTAVISIDQVWCGWKHDHSSPQMKQQVTTNGEIESVRMPTGHDVMAAATKVLVAWWSGHSCSPQPCKCESTNSVSATASRLQ
jgi:hypothetical protein